MATGPYGGFDFEKTILAAKAGAEERNIKVATEVVRNQQFEKEMTLRKSQLNERIRSNKAVEDYRDRTLLQADEHFDENLDQRQTEFAEKHDLDERTHDYFKEISNRRQDLSEAQFEEVKEQFDITTKLNYDKLLQDWNKHLGLLGEDMRQFDEGLDENQRQFNKTYKQRRKEFKAKHKLDEAQFKELRKMNKFKRTMSKAEFEEQVRQFETNTGYKYDALSQDLLKFDEGMAQDLYKYNRSQGFEEYKYQDVQSQTRIDPNLMPTTALPEDYGTDGGWLEGAARIGSSAFAGGVLTTGISGGLGAPVAFPVGFFGGGALAIADLTFGSETADRGALKESEAFMTEVEALAPQIAGRPQNQAAIANQMAELDTALSDAQQTQRVKKLRKRISALENKVTIPAVYNAKSMLSK